MPRPSRKTIGTVPMPSPASPRLGFVLRFKPKAAGQGVKLLESAGFKTASTRDFRKAKHVPNDFGGADVQYFERFGIAIVRRDGERLQQMIAKAANEDIVSDARPERIYRALASPPTLAESATIDHSYLIGYRDAVNQIVDRILRTERARAESLDSFNEVGTTWGLEACKVPLSNLGGAGIRVAVLDTGFDENHPDFRGRTVVKKLFASQSIEGDTNGHGTHCVGTACGPLKPSSAPRYGIAHQAEIYAGKVLGDDGFGTDRSIMAGMDWAVDQQCHVISMSLGAPAMLGEQPDEDYEQIGQACLDAGTLVVAAAGNDSSRPGNVAPVGRPANCRSILAVGAVDKGYLPAYFSNGGRNDGQEVDLAAPGVDVLSSYPGGRYERLNGTSMATPHVAGIAALIAQSDAKFRGWTLWARLIQLVAPLRHPARDVGKGLAQAPS